MSWIKDNQFVATLGGVTLVGAAVLLGFGVRSCQKYDEQKGLFDAASDEAAQFEKSPLYPKEENLNGKKKSLAEYRKQTEELQAAFEKFRPQALSNVSSQEFTGNLKSADAEVRKAFSDVKTTIPDGFFLGFESYTGALARESATGILDYQLAAVKGIMLSLAAAAPSDVINLYRQKLPEESGQEFKPGDGMVARALPIELTFKGSEKSVRDFLSSLSKNTDRFVIIRSVRINNEKLTAPMSTDAKFPVEQQPGGDAGGGGGFVLPGADGAAAAPTEVAPPVNTSQILAQVLGKEHVVVFLRLEVLQFLPAKELPKP